MSRVAKNPVVIPGGVEVKLNGANISIKGAKGALNCDLHSAVDVNVGDKEITFAPKENVDRSSAFAGTMRAIVNNMVVGVSEGYERKLELHGVGYRAQAKGKTVSLSLGFSHPVEHALPEGVTAECPSNTEIVLKGIDKQVLGQVAANIRAYRPPEPYKGKGVRYANEVIHRKEAKKK